MAERIPPSWHEIKGLIERVDEVCRESERVRSTADDMMKRRFTWPERPARRRSDPDPDPSDMGNGSPEM